ncbi:syntaxin-like protein psy1 [Cercophora scortea]|uniref:Syntaxin-like protein psy1 n=1 Tax=Cercophora scortea TaxID=314031 RepID=A0AAE0IN66_9PEZI|nr:syntaxin-like protein psy1 [Cercophora scortea]
MSYNSQYQSNPYQQAPQSEAGYGGYGQPEQHELQSYGQPYDQQQPYGSQAPQQAGIQSATPVLSQQDFLQRVSAIRGEIQSLTNSVHSIAQLHQRALTSSDGAAQKQLEALTAQTQLQNTSIRDQIRQLKGDTERTTDGSFGLKKRQFESLNKDYKSEIQKFLQEEQTYKERYREQIARQFRIVNPEASEEEVREAADADWGNEGIFQTALKSNRSGQASAVLGNVRARHNELQKIEQSIIELAGLFQDLDALIIQQGAVIERAEEQTEQTNVNLDKGNEQVSKGIESARRRRKLKWWCALVVFLIVLAIALGVGITIGVRKAADSNTTPK